MYPASDEPQYMPGSAGNAGVCVMVALLALTLRFVHKWENKKLERAEQEGHVDDGVQRDRRAFGFRYIY